MPMCFQSYSTFDFCCFNCAMYCRPCRRYWLF